ncbi:MAG: transporter [Betaproteobacteria bacterium]
MIVRALASLLTLAATSAFAAHPLQTEDTGTQGEGNVEIENGLARARFEGSSATTYQPQVSLGLSPTLDAIVQPSFVWLRVPGQGAVSGPGDTNIDVKWRFLGRDPWSLALRAGMTAPTSRHGLGLAHGDVAEHALLVATWDSAPTTVHANIGFAHAPAAAGTRATTAHVSAALMQALDERLILTVDGELDQDPDPARRRWPGALLAGAIWTARPGLDLDVGYQRSVDARPVIRQWMAGLTWRFSL